MKHLLFLLALLAALPAGAEIIQWDESIVTDCGRAFNPRKPASFDEPGAFVALLGPPSIGGSSGSSLSAYYAESKEDIARFLDINLTASVNSLAYNLDLSFGFTDFFSSSEQDVTFIVNARRDFGRITQMPVGMTANFTNEVNLMKQTYRGPFLYQAISNRFGSHFISGYKAAARLAVMYKFHFASRAQARQFRASLSVSSGAYDVNAAATSAFSQSNSSVTLDFRLDTLGRGTPPSLWPSNVISSLPDFLVFGQRVEDYWRGLNETNGVPTEYIAEPIENLPGFCQLTDCYSPSNIFNTPYELFMTVHGKFKAWHNRLLYWATDSQHMSWMNSTGQTMVRALEIDARRELLALEQKAKDHFERGTPLVVEDNTLNFLQNFERIPLPSMNVLYQVTTSSARVVLGWVNCGSRDTTFDPPFANLSVYFDATDYGASTRLYYSAELFEQYVRDYAAQSPDPAFLVLANSGFSTNNFWPALKAQAQTDRIVFFFDGLTLSQASRYSWVVRDNAGNPVDELNGLSTRSAGPGAARAALDVDLNVGEMPNPAQAAVDSRTTYQFTVTNLSLSPAYGTLAALPIPAGMQALAASGSQGQAVTTNGVLVVTNGAVLYQVGPLAYGSSATIRLDLVPLRTGVLTAATPATVTVGDGLSDPDLSNNSVALAPLTVEGPRLLAARAPGALDLTWVSETGRLNLQSATALSTMPSWSAVTNAPSVAGSARTLRLPTTGPRKFFRLQMQPL